MKSSFWKRTNLPIRPLFGASRLHGCGCADLEDGVIRLLCSALVVERKETAQERVHLNGTRHLTKKEEFFPLQNVDGVRFGFRECSPLAGPSLSPKESPFLGQGFPKSGHATPGGGPGGRPVGGAQLSPGVSTELLSSTPPLHINLFGQVSVQLKDVSSR